MRANFTFLFFSNIFIIFFSTIVMGAAANFVDQNGFTSAAPDFYQMTFEELEFCTDATCSTPTKVCTAALTFDITSVSAGSDIGSWCSLTGLPMGTTYTHIRLVINRSFVMKGSAGPITVDSNDYYCSTADVTGTGAVLGEASRSAAGGSAPTAVNQTMILIDGSGTSNNIALADGSTVTNSYTNNAGEVPDGSVSWCFGSTSAHASSNAQCTAANTTGSTTWANNANANHFQIIYALPSTYTVGPVSPKFTVKVAESKTLDSAIYPEGAAGKCNFQPGNPIFTFSLEQ